MDGKRKVTAEYCGNVIHFGTMADCSRFFNREAKWVAQRLKRSKTREINYEGWTIKVKE